jgi:hypothetical protein
MMVKSQISDGIKLSSSLLSVCKLTTEILLRAEGCWSLQLLHLPTWIYCH